MPLIPRLAGLRKIAGPFFSEKIHVKTTYFYNVSQVICSSLQYYRPEWAGSILKVQRVFIVLDAAFLALDAWHLYKKVSKVLNNPDRNYSRGRGILALFTLIASQTGAVFVLKNNPLRPADDLTEILKKVAPSEEIKGASIDWEKPWIHVLTQWISLNRFFIQSFSYLDPTSPVRYTYLRNAGFQMLHFLNISRLPFLKYHHVFSRTLSANESMRTGKVEHSFYFLVASLKDNNYLPLAVQTIHHFCTRIVRQFSRNFFLPPHTSLLHVETSYTPIPNSLCDPPPFYHNFFRQAAEVPKPK